MSKVIKYVCDCCENEIPMIKKKDMFGIEREFVQTGEIKSLKTNMSQFGIDLCKECAHKIDVDILEFKSHVLNQLGYLDKKGNKYGSKNL